jgi:NADPH:quinone reductase-like Zn-dependent oxidoreductase
LSVKEVVPIPDTLPLHLAASLPVAGLTALQGLRYGGNLRGKHVLVTGATGGVGRFAIQLGSQMGAEVTALVRKPAHRETLLKLGATRVVTDVSGLERPVDHVIELVGGAMFDQALQAANPTRAMVMLIGDASGERRTATPKPGQQIIQFRVNSALATDLLELVGKLAGGTLDPQIGWRGHWSQINEAADFLMSRQVLGKLVLDIHS